MIEPRASRPYMPGYGISEEESGLLPWIWAEERLIASHDYWLASVRPDGRPHVMPVWGVWADLELWFSCSPGSRKSRNLELRPSATATTDDARNPVIVEGTVERVEDPEAIERFAQRTNVKYDVDYSAQFFLENATFKMLPIWAFGVADGAFENSPTRWTFA